MNVIEEDIMLDNEKNMYKYNLLRNSSEIEKNFINSFVELNEYNNFAITHANGFVHMFDFIKEAHIVSYGEVIKNIETISADTYYIMLNPSQCYCKEIKILQHDYKVAEISCKNLLALLNDQKEDMQGEELCYVRNPERTYYWDMVIFDHTYKWCLAITHEDNADGNRLCYIAYPTG